MKKPSDVDIQFAHDILCQIVNGDVSVPLSAMDTVAAHACHDVLAWLLAYECGQSFDMSLAKLTSAMADAGYVVTDTGKPAPVPMPTQRRNRH